MKNVIRKRMNIIIDRNAKYSDVAAWPSNDVREVGRLYTRLKSLSKRGQIVEIDLEDLPFIDTINDKKIKIVGDNGMVIQFT